MLAVGCWLLVGVVYKLMVDIFILFIYYQYREIVTSVLLGFYLKLASRLSELFKISALGKYKKIREQMLAPDSGHTSDLGAKAVRAHALLAAVQIAEHLAVQGRYWILLDQ